jgi:hypothetical protein
VEFGLVDILLAALYDVRTTDGEPNPESGWWVGVSNPFRRFLLIFGILPISSL